MDKDLLATLTKTIEETNKKTIEEANNKQSIEIKEHINKEIQALKQRFEEELNKKNKEWESKYTELKSRYEKLEKNLKKNNIIIFGLENTPDELENLVVNTLNHYLGLNLAASDISDVYKIGKQPNKKPIITKFVSYLNKQKVLKNARKLKGSGISIAEDLSPEERKANKILRQHLHKAQNNKLKAFIKKGKLIINGVEYTADQLTEEEESYTEEIVQNTPSVSTDQYQEIEDDNDTEDVFIIGNTVKEFKRQKLTKTPINLPHKISRSSSRLNSEKSGKIYNTKKIEK